MGAVRVIKDNMQTRKEEQSDRLVISVLRHERKIVGWLSFVVGLVIGASVALNYVEFLDLSESLWETYVAPGASLFGGGLIYYIIKKLIDRRMDKKK